MGNEMVNPFDQDAFNMVSLCAAIDILPTMYGRLGQLGLFADDGITTRTAIVEEYNGVLNLLKTQPVGAPPQQGKTGKRKVRSFVVPHIPLADKILPEEFQGLRAFGQATGLETLASIMNKHLQTTKNKYDITKEYLRMGALKGIILDADASTLYNLYTEYGISAKTVSFALTTPSPLTDVASKCREVVRHIEDHLHGEVMTGVRCLVSAEFFDSFISHPNVEKFYLNWQAAANISGQDPRKGFSFGGIIWEEYRGVATDADNVSRRFIASGSGHAYPEGTMDTFKMVYAPGNFIETANTPGIPLYAKQALDEMGRWVDLLFESNPLPLCLRPEMLVEVTRT